jgi:hypothetical protein
VEEVAEVWAVVLDWRRRLVGEEGRETYLEN